MNAATIEQSFREKVCAKIRIVLDGDERFRVFTPFIFEDGDHLAIVLKKRENTWVLSDEGNTYMRLTYDLDEKDFQKGTRQKIISSTLSAFRVEDRDGELIARVAEDRFGDALFSFVQALLKVTVNCRQAARPPGNRQPATGNRPRQPATGNAKITRK